MMTKLYIIFILLFLLLSCSDRNPQNPFDPNSRYNTAPMQGELHIYQITDSQVTLGWQLNSSIKGNYIVKRKINLDNDYVILDSVDINSSFYNDTELLTTNTYIYQLIGANGIVQTEPLMNSINPAFAEITDFNIQQEDIFSAKLTWQHDCDYEEGYIIERQEITTRENDPYNSEKLPLTRREAEGSKWSTQKINSSKDTNSRVFIQIADLPANSIEFIDEEIIPNILYEYKIHSYTTLNTSTASILTFNNAIPSPTNLNYEKLSISTIKLTWQDCSNAENGYKIDKKIGINDWQIEYIVLGENIEEWVDTNAEINENLQYRVYAFSGENQSASIETGIIDNTFPAPTNLSYEKLTIMSIKLMWDDNSIDEEGFIIDKKVGENSWQIGYAEVSEEIEEWTDVNAEINEDIQFRIYAFNEEDQSSYSNTEIIDNTIPSPSNLIISQLNVHTFSINWDDNCISEEGFTIERKIDDGVYTLIYTTDENVTTYIDDINLRENFEEVYYRIKAFHQTFYSDAVENSYLINFPAPSNLSFNQPTITTILLTWQDNSSGEDGFIIDKKVGINDWQIGFSNVSENIEEWSDENAETNENIQYRVYAYSGDNQSDTIETGIIDNTIPTPESLSYTFENISGITGDVHLFWDYNFVGIDGFKIDKKVGTNNWQTEYAIVEENVTDWIDFNTNIDEEIYYRLSAYYGNNNSDNLEVYVIITFTKTFGGSDNETGYCLQQTIDGGYILIGSTSSFGNETSVVWLIKTDAQGNEEWDQTFDSIHYGAESGYSVQQTTDEGYILGCFINRSDPYNDFIYLIKTDTQGNEIWNRTYGYSISYQGEPIQQTSDGGYIIVGRTIDPYNILVIKTDSQGIEEWDQIYESSLLSGYSIKQTDDNGYILVGSTNSYNNTCLIKTDSQGNEEWRQTYGGDWSDYCYSLQIADDGGYILAGYTNSFGNGSYDAWIIKTDSQGIEEWSQTYGGILIDESYLIQKTIEGGYILVGDTSSFGNGSYDSWIIKTDSQGNEEWNQTYGGNEEERSYSVRQTTDNGYVFIGKTESFGNGGSDIWLIKTDKYGNVNEQASLRDTNRKQNTKNEKVKLKEINNENKGVIK